MRYAFALVPSPFRPLKAQHSLNSLAAFLLLVVSGCMLGCGGGGGNGNPPPVTAPSGLSYGQAAITATMNQAVASDTPTVTGVVSSYTVSPTLPPGLSLNGLTGTISGTPTAVAAKASYTVTASNAGGSTKATIQITVSMAPPTGLAYSQPAIDAAVSQAITPDTPTVTGTVSSYAVSPALPAGLSLDSSTGIITGNPTAVTAQASYTVTASNAGGSTTATVQITVSVAPPAGLAYSQSAIDAAVSQAITPDTPTVTGTVSSYAVIPVLPAGLSLDSSTGIISGTPMALAPMASYTVTASNAGGSSSAAILISVTVLLPAPTALMYPQTVIGTFVGQEITPDIPGTAGTVTTFTVSPALPPGLSLDPATGIISGTPTAPAAQTTYVVTGSNSGGSITAAVSPAITVTPAPNVLLQLGDQNEASTLLFVSSRVLSEDQYGSWILWDYKAGTIMARGDAGLGGGYVQGFSSIYTKAQSEMAGPTLAIGIPGGVQVRASSDGHVLGMIVSPGFGIQTGAGLTETDSWQLASDGSYISVETVSGLFVYSPTGQLVFSISGNYLDPNFVSPTQNIVPSVFAAPGQVQVANGPAGLNAIETISVPSGSSTISPPFQGPFNSWFTDGGRFMAGSEIYSSSGVPQATLPFSWPFPPGGMGNWVWVSNGISTSVGPIMTSFSIYSIGSSTPALTVSSETPPGPSGTTLAVALNSLKVIDLSGTTPTEADYTIPPVNHAFPGEVVNYAAVSATQWVVDEDLPNTAGRIIVDGASLPDNLRFLGTGSLLSLAVSAGNVAIATAGGQIVYFDPANTTPEGSIPLTSGEVELSSDGSVLAASSEDDSLLNIYSLPSGTISNTLSYSSQSAYGLLSDFTLSESGTTLGQVMLTQASGWACTMQVTPVSGSPTIWSRPLAPWSDDRCMPILLSPDGTLIAVNNDTFYESTVVTIYQNGQQVTTVSGVAVGWIDNGRLLVNNYTAPSPDGRTYLGCTIYSSTGQVLATPQLPELLNIQPVTSNTVYAPNQNAIYSLTTGQATWTNPDSGTSPGGAVAGPYVVYESEGQVIAVAY